ncbi:hypothetical protein [Undibacterium sp. Ji49W]|uniref:hypothetical protein n=1 Tax=Undibacterium sp. Ji49W TaxID=3413040 RepID=UPI003BF255CD
MTFSASSLPAEIQLITAVARFIDLHDSRREYGKPAEFTTETRNANGDGQYLAIGIAVVSRLYSLDQTSSHDYLHLDALFDAALSDCPGIAKIDVQYVLNVLRRPTEIWYLGREDESQPKTLRSEKRGTAIIEKTDYADEYRLTSAGRSFIGLSNAAKDSLYIRGDACNLLDAIQNSDFDEMPGFADEIIRELREAILDVRSALERRGRSEIMNKYIDNFDRYRKVIEGTLEIIEQAEHEMASPATMGEFMKWADSPGNHAIDSTYYSLSSHLDRVRQVLEVFNRVVQELVTASLKNDRTAAAPPAFLEFAIHQVKNPLKPEVENFLLRQWGAMELQTPFYSPLDGLHAIKIKKVIPPSLPQSFAHDGYELISHIGNLHFLSRFGTDIVDALRIAPLRLSDAIEKGWFWHDKGSALGDLIGIFSAPESLPITEKIVISLTRSFLDADVTDGVLFFTDLEISIMENEIEQ